MAADIEKEAEARLIVRFNDLHANILKVAHHGSKTSSSLEFLQAVNPQEAVIMAGWKNHFDHPSPQILKRLMGQKVRIWRGDLCGEIVTRVGAEGMKMTSIVSCGNSVK
jgi:competence protein ComEC